MKKHLAAAVVLMSLNLPTYVNAQSTLINPTILNGSFEVTGGTNGLNGQVTFASGLVNDWTVWAGVSTASNDSGVQNRPEASNGQNIAYLQGGNADYDLTSFAIEAGDVFTYTWDWVEQGRGSATAELGYWNGSAVVGIASTATSFQSNTGTGLGLGTTYTVLSGDPAIGDDIAMTIMAPSGSNYPEVDNFVLTVTSVPEPSTVALGGLGIFFLVVRKYFSR